MGDLAAEVCERLEQDLEENERKATLLTISFQYVQNKNVESHTRSVACISYKQEKVAEQAFSVVSKATQQFPVAFLGISASKFVKAKGSENFKNFFRTNVSEQHNSTMSSSKESYHEIEGNKSTVTDEANFEEELKQSKDEKIETDLAANKNDSIEHSSKRKARQKSSPCSKIKKSLKTDNFKKSFFMNILKEKQPNKNDDSTSVTETEVSSESDPKNHDSSSSGDDDIFENDKEITSTNSCDTKSRESNSISISSCDALKKLKEIFPDLNDIDPTVVKLLPLALQEEAKKLLKMKDVTESCEKNEENNKAKETNKLSRGRPPKSKTSNQKSNIQNFFIKTDASSSSNEFQKCPECGQLISVSKIEEHKDYHVARNLQREMNQISNSNDTRKRKALEQSPPRPKKRSGDEIVFSIPKPESVASFFQQ